MKLTLTIGLIILMDIAVFCQSGKIVVEDQAFRAKLLQTYHDLRATPDDRVVLNDLKNLPFYPYDSAFCIRALLDTAGAKEFFEMKTSRGRTALYRRYGYLTFSVGPNVFHMPVYQAQKGSDELFFPFTDKTNGESTYGGGRYIDLVVPKGFDLVVDFNHAYNPYCAYSHVYSCEIPPEENHFPVKIEAGLKY